MADLETILRSASIPQAVKAQAWDLYHSSANEDDFAAKVQKLAMPNSVKADLWDLKRTESQQRGTNISPTLLESRRAASTSEFEANQPQSTIVTRAQEAARGLLEPFDLHNVPGLVESVGGLVYDALTGKAESVVRKTGELAKGAVMAPIKPVQNLIEGATSGDYDKAAYGAGGFASQTAPAVASAVEMAQRVVPRAPTGTAQELYRSALKAPTTMDAAKVKQAVETGLKHEIPISEQGIQKLNTLVNDVNDAIAAQVKSSPGSVNKLAVTKRLGQTAQDFAEQVNPTKDLAAISEAGNEFLDLQPSQIPVAQAQALKVGTYKQLRGKYGELGSATTEAQKALARGLREELANQIPELKALNARDADLLQLDPLLERAVNRAANANKGRLGPMIAVGVAKSLTQSTPVAVATGILKAVLDDPEMASRLAIAINKAQGKNPLKYGAPSMGTAVAKVAALRAALGNVKTSDDSSEKE